jgi:hypothetical protein
MYLRLSSLFMALLVAGFSKPVHAGTSAPVFAYFQVGEDEDPLESVRVDQFEAHLRLIRRDHLQVVPLSAIVAAVTKKHPLPEKAIGISFDDAYRSVADNALPLLREAKLPATIFVTPRLVDRGGDYMSWEDLREAVSQGFTIGVKIDLDDADTPVKTLAAVNEASARIHAELGITPSLFSYADGIAEKPMRDIVQSRGFTGAFALQSEPVSEQSDPYLLPRFPMIEATAASDRFRNAANALPLAVEDVLPADPAVITGPNPPQIGFSVVSQDVDLADLTCTIEGQGKAPLEAIGPRFEIRPAQPFETDDTTWVNCTAPAIGANAGRWYWLGFNFYVP